LNALAGQDFQFINQTQMIVKDEFEAEIYLDFLETEQLTMIQ